MNKLLSAVLFVSMLGCLDYTSVTRINTDGSGIASVEIKVPRKQGIDVRFDGDLDDSKHPDGWVTTSKGVDTFDSYILHYLKGRFSKPEAVANFISEGDEPGITVTRTNEITRYHLKRTVEPLDPKEKRQAKTLLTFIPGKKDLEEYHWTEILIIEGDIIEHNATFRRGDTLMWRINMEELIGLMDEAYEMEAL